MKIDIVTCFESNEERASFLYELCKENGHETKVITTDFSHINKKKRNNIPNSFIAVDTLVYRNNLSLTRLASHKKFASDAFRLIDNDKPDLVWVMAPCLSLIKEAKTFKKNNPSSKVIIDIIDMWPESLPLRFFNKLLPFRMWKRIRTNNIDCADEVVTECNLYRKELTKEYSGKISTIYWAKGSSVNKTSPINNDDFSLCYIGSINNIIDIDRIKKIISKIKRNVTLHIIGDGERRDEMLSKLKDVCNVQYHGSIYDEKLKDEILSKCHAGLNIYKKGLYIGLTVKSIDYFRCGLPIVNNIKGDTWDFVLNKNVGINIDNNSLIDINKLIEIRNSNQDIIDLYNNNFTKQVFQRNCSEVIDRVMKK